MDWYAKIIKTASKPPSYLVERVSDIRHASEMLKGSPREAMVLISRVIAQLEQHHDVDYVSPLKEACKMALDSPKKATELLNKTAELMVIERDIADSEAEEAHLKWKKK